MGVYGCRVLLEYLAIGSVVRGRRADSGRHVYVGTNSVLISRHMGIV